MKFSIRTIMALMVIASLVLSLYWQKFFPEPGIYVSSETVGRSVTFFVKDTEGLGIKSIETSCPIRPRKGVTSSSFYNSLLSTDTLLDGYKYTIDPIEFESNVFVLKLYDENFDLVASASVETDLSPDDF